MHMFHLVFHCSRRRHGHKESRWRGVSVGCWVSPEVRRAETASTTSEWVTIARRTFWTVSRSEGTGLFYLDVRDKSIPERCEQTSGISAGCVAKDLKWEVGGGSQNGMYR